MNWRLGFGSPTGNIKKHCGYMRISSMDWFKDNSEPLTGHQDTGQCFVLVFPFRWWGISCSLRPMMFGELMVNCEYIPMFHSCFDLVLTWFSCQTWEIHFMVKICLHKKRSEWHHGMPSGRTTMDVACYLCGSTRLDCLVVGNIFHFLSIIIPSD